MTNAVLLAGSNDPSTLAQLACVDEALSLAGVAASVIAPMPLPPGGGRFFPARRRDDATLALDTLANDRPLLIECFDPDAARCACDWRDRPGSAATVMVAADAVRADPSLTQIADAVLAATPAHARACAEAGFDPSRVIIAPRPVQPRAVFEPGGESVLCVTPIGPGRGLIELVDAWAASGCGAESNWVLRFGGPVEHQDFAQSLARRAATCPGVCLTERLDDPDSEIANAALLVDPEGHACSRVLNAVSRGRAVFAPAGSATAEAVCTNDSPFVYPTGSDIQGLISVFDRLGGHAASELAAAGIDARERLLRTHAFIHAVPARLRAYQQAAEHRRGTTTRAAPTHPSDTAAGRPNTWARFESGNQSPQDTRRLQRTMLACHSQGLRRIALYGAGAFIKRCGDALCEPPLEIIGFIDDDQAKRGKRVFGYPILCPDVALTADLDAVILTAPSVEETLWHRTAWFRDANIRVIPINQQQPEIRYTRVA